MLIIYAHKILFNPVPASQASAALTTHSTLDRFLDQNFRRSAVSLLAKKRKTSGEPSWIPPIAHKSIALGTGQEVESSTQNLNLLREKNELQLEALKAIAAAFNRQFTY